MIRFILALASLAFLPMALFAAPAAATERELSTIACPRTAVAPGAQKRLDAGEKPEIAKSWYKPGIVNPQGFCTITLSPNGQRMIQVYNEATSVGQVPIRFEYSEFGLYAFVGQKAAPFGTGRADMTCTAPQQGEVSVRCTMALDFAGAMLLSRSEGRGVDSASISINPKAIFGHDIKAPNISHYDATTSGFLTSGNLQYNLRAPDCSQSYWKGVATEIKLYTGSRNGDAINLAKSFNLVGADPYNAEIVGPQFTVKGDQAADIFQSVMTQEAVGVEVQSACEAPISKNFLTELPRILNYVYEIIKPRMLRQS